MTSTLTCVAAIVVVALTERSVEHLLFAITALFFNVALLLFVVTDFERAILLSGMLAAAIAGLSIVKFNHSALKLTVSDLPLAFAGTLPFFVSQYPRTILGVLSASILLAFAAAAVLLYAAGSPISLEPRILVFGLALLGFATAAAMKGSAASLRQTLTQRRCFYSTFIASLIDPLSWQQFGGLTLSDIANEPLPLKEAIPARCTDLPDILVIQHESIFDPRIFGLPLEPVVDAFLSPADGYSGCLNVDIFGGGSWQSEFSFLTGLSSASFGSSAYYLFKKGAGRFHSSLPHSLASLGYHTTLTSSCRRNFLNYDEFYSSIGINERIFIDDFPPPFDVRSFEATNSDELFLEAAIDAHINAIADRPGPRFLYLLTNFNHGPHGRRLVPPGQFESERNFATASIPDAGYGEYYARLATTASTWQRLRVRLANNFPRRPMLIVHYGDHQPVLTRRIDRRLKLPVDPRRGFRTFYAMEALNMPPGQFGPGRGAELDIAFLGTVALQKAGLPLDAIFSTRASLLDDCGKAYFASTSERKRRFHRTLVDLRVVDLMPNVERARCDRVIHGTDLK